MKRTTLAVLLLACAAGEGLAASLGAVQPSVGSNPPPPVQAPKQGPTVQTIYDVERLRDPFQLESTTLVAHHKFSVGDFSIHNLTLKGIMADRRADFAVFADNNYGYTLVLRQGRLFSPKGKPVPGVTGKLDVKQRRASLQTSDGDVQVFRLGAQTMD